MADLPPRNPFRVERLTDGTDRIRIGGLPADNPILSRAEALDLAAWLALATGATPDEWINAFDLVTRQ